MATDNRAKESAKNKATVADAQEAQTSPPILEKAARAILQRVKQMDAGLGKHLAQDAWQVLTEHVVLQWCGCAMVGVLQADALLLLWDRCVQDRKWIPSIACQSSLPFCSLRDQNRE